MSVVPSPGFRHAATLLITNRLRAVANGLRGLPPSMTDELARLAADLRGLAADMKAPPEAGPWLVAEYGHALDRLADELAAGGILRTSLEPTIARAKDQARDQLADIDNPGQVHTRDLFLLYAPEDRLPLAAPLAIDLTKRRFSVAFSEYEVAGPGELRALLERGLREHRAGGLLLTPALVRLLPAEELEGAAAVARDGTPPRLCMLRPPVSVHVLARWLKQHRERCL